MKTRYFILIIFLQAFVSFTATKAQSTVADTAIGSTYQNNLNWSYYTYNTQTKEKIKDLPYSSVSEFSEGLALVKCVDGKYGFIDENGNEVIPCMYEFFSDSFSEGLACVKLNNVYLFIDKAGKEVFNYRFSLASRFSEGLAYVEYQRSGYTYRGFIDKSERMVLPLKYDYAHAFSNGLALVKSKESYDKNYGFIDKTGNEIIPPKYDFATDFRNGLAFVILEDKEGYIDTKGNEIIPVIYEKAGAFFDKLYKVMLNGKWGIFDGSAKEVVPFKYTEIDNFCFEGLVKVKANLKCGFLNCENGKEIIPPIYDEINLFHSGLAKVRIDKKYGYIDNKGVEIVSPKYDEVFDFHFEFAKIKHGDKFGYIDLKGNEIIPPIYDEAENFGVYNAKVTLKGKSFYIDKTGKKVKIK